MIFIGNNLYQQNSLKITESSLLQTAQISLNTCGTILEAQTATNHQHLRKQGNVAHVAQKERKWILKIE